MPRPSVTSATNPAVQLQFTPQPQYAPWISPACRARHESTRASPHVPGLHSRHSRAHDRVKAAVGTMIPVLAVFQGTELNHKHQVWWGTSRPVNEKGTISQNASLLHDHKLNKCAAFRCLLTPGSGPKGRGGRICIIPHRPPPAAASASQQVASQAATGLVRRQRQRGGN